MHCEADGRSARMIIAIGSDLCNIERIEFAVPLERTL
jgi:hypothetical protein